MQSRDRRKLVGFLAAIVVCVGAGAGVHCYAEYQRDQRESRSSTKSVQDYIDAPSTRRSPSPSYTPSSGPNCTKGCRCGNSCIDCSKRCRK